MLDARQLAALISEAADSLRITASCEVIALALECKEPRKLAAAFLRLFVRPGFGLDRIAVFELIHDEPAFVMGQGRDPELSCFGRNVVIEDGEHYLDSPYGRGNGLVIRVGKYVFCFDYVETESRFSSQDIIALRAVSRTLRGAIEGGGESSEKDVLTGLPNRDLAMRMLNDMGQTQPEVIVAFLDIDPFRRRDEDFCANGVRDSAFRMVAGEAQTIASVAGGFAGRAGGDQFMIVVPGRRPDVLDNICSAIENDRSVVANGHPLAITVSIGFALWQASTNGRGFEAALAEADSNTWTADRKGGNRVVGTMQK